MSYSAPTLEQWASEQPFDYSERHLFFLRRALTASSSSAGLMAQAKAVEWLLDEEVALPSEAIRRRLHAIVDRGLALATYQGGQAAAKASKIRERLDQEPDEWPSETPDEPAPVGYWPYGPGCPPEVAPWEELDLHDTQGMRDAWRTRRMGRPPWRRGQVPVPDDEECPAEPDAA